MPVAVLIVAAILQLPLAVASDRLVVFAAASTKNAIDAAVSQYRSPGSVVVSYGASSVLARQIENGAPADLYISANIQWMDYLTERGLIANSTRFNLTTNRLALVAAPGYVVPEGLLPIRPMMPLRPALGATGRLAVGDPRHVPAGRYVQMALESLNIWSALRSRLAPATNVRLALAMVARGEAPLGIVYASDLYASSTARRLGLLPASAHPPIRYPVAIIRNRMRPPVQQFAAYLRSAEVVGILTRFGFGDHAER